MIFANRIRLLREKRELLQRHLAAALEIDTPMYSKIECGDRRAKREQVVKLAELLLTDEKELLSLWLASQIIELIENEKELAGDALKLAQNSISQTNENQS
jgi:transcriptional regulator with XRE-family HTH domain